MAKSALELAVETGKWDAGLKKAKSALDSFTDANGGLQQALGKDSDKMQKFVQMMGGFESTAKTAKGQMNDYKGTIEALTMQYNRMTDAQKAAIGQDYLRSIDQMRQKYQAVAEEVQKINQSLSQMPKADALSSTMPSGGGLFGGGKLDGMLQVFGGNLMTKGAGMALNFAGELGDMVKQGIELAKQGEGIRIAFERLGRGDILQGLREATHGTVTDLELMKAAVKFNDFKLPLDELGTMLAFAQQKAKDTGQSVDYMVDSIVTGLGRKSLMILDNLGLSASEIKEKMAETGDMTKAVGAIIREQMSKAGDYVETAADRATKANVEVENAMTRLGETFQPLSDSATSMWTDIKVGALDLLNNAVKPLIKALKEAGVLGQNARNNAGYENLGGDAKVNRMIAKLGDGNGPKAYRTYKAQMAEFDRYANSLKFKIAAYGDDKSGVAQSAVAKLQTELAGVYAMRMEYERRAQELHKKSTTKIVEDNNEEEQSIDSLNKKLKDLQEQRKKAIKAGDTDLSNSLLKQINQTKKNITGLRGGTTTTTTHTLTKQERAQESFTKAEQSYKQALEQAALELKAGTITRAEAKKKEMQAAEQRWKAIGDARNINDSENLRKAQDEAAAEYKRLAAEAKTATEHQKAVDKATRDLENANQKLATARTEMAQAKQQGDLQAYNTAKDKATAAQQEITRLEKVKVDVERGKVDLPDIPKEIEQIVNTHQGELMTAEIAKEITQTINTRLGRIVTPDILESITQTINTKIGRVVTPDILESITQTINTKIGRVVTPDILESITQTINTKIGRVVTPAIAKELTQEVNVKTGKVDLKPIPTEITQKVDVEQGNVNLPAIPAEVTQTVDVETGSVNLLNIPEVIEQVVNTHQGELMTADIATEITQKINTVLGNIVKPEILDEVTQTINTKVGEVITPEIAKEVTQVVNVETGTVDLEPIPTETTTKVLFQADTRNINAAISDVKKEIATIPVGTIKFNLDQTTLVDLTTLKTLIDEQVKNGLKIDPEVTQGLFSKIQLGIDIEDTTWQDLIDKINEKLKKLGLDTIKLDLTTGEKSKKGREKKNPYIQTDENGNEKSSLAGVMGGMATGMSEMVSGMENLGIEIPKGFKDTISAVQGVVSILNSIVVIVQAIEAISAIDSIIPFAHGGIVHAANGYVSGTTYSGDQIPAMLNAGEVVLNRGQQGVLAASLQAVGQSGEGGGGGRPYVSGELIWLGLNNYLNRSGRGEIVTSKKR